MDITLVLYILHLAFVANISPEVSAAMYQAAQDHGLDRYDLAATLISEKSGSRADFSLVGSQLYGVTWKWDPEVKGADGETGLFQVVDRWAHKAGYQASQLTDPKVNVQVGAYTLAQAFASHADCEQGWHNHPAIAHWKCRPGERDQGGQCRASWSKWVVVRASLGRLLPIPGRPVTANIRAAQRRQEAHQDRLRRLARHKARQRAMRRAAAQQAGS